MEQKTSEMRSETLTCERCTVNTEESKQFKVLSGRGEKN